jgi:hypothetical protein
MLPKVIGAPWGGLVITVWFPDRRWFLLVILNLSSTIAVRAVLTVIHPPPAVTTWTNFHCQHLHLEPFDRVLPSVMGGPWGSLVIR